MAKLSEESLNKLKKPEQIAFSVNLPEKTESKALFWMGKIHSYFISNGSVKIHLQEKGPSIPITQTADFEKYFPGMGLSSPR